VDSSWVVGSRSELQDKRFASEFVRCHRVADHALPFHT
jgi:hypothetical protein